MAEGGDVRYEFIGDSSSLENASRRADAALGKPATTAAKAADKVDAALKKQAKAADKAAVKTSALGKSFQGLASSGGSVTGMMSAFLGPLGVAGALIGTMATGIWSLVQANGDWVDKTVLLADTLGISTSATIALGTALDAAGLSIEAGQGALMKFTSQLGEAAGGSKTAMATFDKLGVAFEINGKIRSTEDAFRDTLDALAAIEDPTERATAAIDMFGTRGGKVAAAFKDGSGSLDHWNDVAEEFGAVVGPAATKASADLDEAMARLDLSVTGATSAWGTEFTPTVVESINQVALLVSWLGKMADYAETAWKWKAGPLPVLLDKVTDALWRQDDALDEVESSADAATEAFNKQQRAVMKFFRDIDREEEELAEKEKKRKEEETKRHDEAVKKIKERQTADNAARSAMLAGIRDQESAETDLAALRAEVAGTADEEMAEIDARLTERLLKLDKIAKATGYNAEVETAANEAMAAADRERADATIEADRKIREGREDKEKEAEGKLKELEAFEADVHRAGLTRWEQELAAYDDQIKKAGDLGASVETLAEIESQQSQAAFGQTLELVDSANAGLGSIGSLLEGSGQAYAEQAANARAAAEATAKAAGKSAEEQIAAGDAAAAAANKSAATQYKRAQAFAYSNAVISMAAGVARAWMDYPFPASLVVAGAAALAGAVQVQQIANQTPTFGDTPGAVYMPQGGPINVAPGDSVIASKDPEEGLRQAQQAAGRWASSRSGGVPVVNFDGYRHIATGRGARDAVRSPGAAGDINRMTGRTPGKV